MAMMARRWVPSPTFLSSSCASTLKRSLRPSTSSSSARTVTFLPFGVAPKCFTFTSKPTVVCPSGRCGCTAWMPARSIKPIIDGVDSTPSPPMCVTMSLSSTVVTISALSPGVRSVDMSFPPELRQLQHFCARQSKPRRPLEACAVRRQGLVVALGDHRRLYGRRCLIGTAGIERRRRVIFDAELYGPGGCLAGDFGGGREGKIDARADASRRDHVAVLNDPGLFVCRPDEREQIDKGPMRRCPPSLEQSGDAQDDRAGADRGDVLRGARLLADELYGVAIAERVDHPQVSPGHANQVERRTVGEGVRRHEAHAAVTRYGRRRFRDDVGRGLGNAREHLQRPGEIKQRQIGEDDEADVEARHCCSPFLTS